MAFPLGTIIGLESLSGVMLGGNDKLYSIIPVMTAVLGCICLTSFIITRVFRKIDTWK